MSKNEILFDEMNASVFLRVTAELTTHNRVPMTHISAYNTRRMTLDPNQLNALIDLLERARIAMIGRTNLTENE